MKVFSWQKKTLFDDFEVYELSCKNSGNPFGDISISVSPLGMNTCIVSIGGKNVIDIDMERLKKGANYGIPVLYPTPNRVTDGTIEFEGKKHSLIYNGRLISSHGLARLVKFEITDISADENCAKITGKMPFNKQMPWFEAFPFESDFYVAVTLYSDSFSIAYSVVNGGERLPFGFALHPFFYKIDGEHDTQIVINSTDLMHITEENIKLGQYYDFKNTEVDFTKPTSVADVPSAVKGGTVHYNVKLPDTSEVIYKKSGFKIVLKATDDMDKLVTFFPAGFDYFCLENQTCSIDAINLEARGIKAGMLVAQPNQTLSGKVTFAVEKL